MSAAAPVPGVPASVVVVPVPPVAPRNPVLALVFSLFFPGAGQMYNGQVGKGVAILIGYFFCWLLSFLLLPLFVALGLCIWAMVDAYQTAKQNAYVR